MAITWPEIVEHQWVKVATNVTSGKITRLKSNFTFWATHVATGEAAPDADIKLKSPVIFEDSKEEYVDSSYAIDVYLWIENADTNNNDTAANSVQVEL